ncbi:hypothetical protein BIW11_14325 [Tropilaelaps mercedesae]|uniref:MICOS complex subunit MIC13 n=1 Tax=Tropilaelaps mercedesae TaxID=418985 RepID=A0A1V9WY59_9ACAR|nr:hypothetical protein BIW11_14325 [Tropilaelaps mercedesae]
MKRLYEGQWFLQSAIMRGRCLPVIREPKIGYHSSVFEVSPGIPFYVRFQMGWLWTTTKLAIVGSVGYGSCKADIWGDNQTTVNYISKQCQSCDRLKYYKALIPSCEDMRIRWADSWNGGVRTVFSFVDQFPQHVANGASWTVKKVRELSVISPTQKEEPKAVPKANGARNSE